MSEDYDQGFRDGLAEAARMLRHAAEDHMGDSKASKKVLEGNAHSLAAALFYSWANGIEMAAEKLEGGERKPESWQWRFRLHEGDWSDWNDGKVRHWVIEDGKEYEERPLYSYQPHTSKT